MRNENIDELIARLTSTVRIPSSEWSELAPRISAMLDDGAVPTDSPNVLGCGLVAVGWPGMRRYDTARTEERPRVWLQLSAFQVGGWVLATASPLDSEHHVAILFDRGGCEIRRVPFA